MNTRTLIRVLSISLAVLLLILGVGAWERSRNLARIADLEEDVRSLEEEVSRLLRENRRLEEELAAAQETEVTVYYVRSLPRDFWLEPVTKTVKAADNLQEASLCALLEDPPAGSGLLRAVPEGTRLLGLAQEGDLVTAKFSREIMSNFNGGARLEELLVYAIVNTLTQFPKIKRVQILVDGRRVESLGGHVGVAEPLTRREEGIIRPEE